MKILHTADWHLGKKLESVSRLGEQQAVLDEIIAIADREAVDAVIVAGDLFDTYNPPTEAVDLFYQSLKRLAKDGARPVIAIAGNHDSPDRIEAPDPLARECGILLAGYPNACIKPFALESGLQVLKSDEGFVELKLPEHDAPLRLLLTPYANEYRLKTFMGVQEPEAELRTVLEEQWQRLADQYCDQKGVNLLMAHLFVVQQGQEKPEEPEGEKPIDHIGGASEVYSDNIPSSVHYAALGHLHQNHTVAQAPCPVVYSGSPVAYSFSEAGQSKYVTLIDAEPGQEVNVKPVALTQGKPLRSKKVEGLENAVEWLQANQEALVELTLVTDDFIAAQDRKKLYNVHPGIIALIPEVKHFHAADDDHSTKVDLQKDRMELFKDYFEYKHGHQPDATMLALFKEILAHEKGEDI